jgi:hypothetical protein
MTDNTPRPEPMSRESVLAVLDRLRKPKHRLAAVRFGCA